MELIVNAQNVTKIFGKDENENRVLDGANLQIGKGDFVSLMGASGSGKSTMLYLIGGLDTDFTGDIEVCGKQIRGMSDKEMSDLRLNKIGFVFQFYNLVQNLSVEENIMLPIKMGARKIDSPEDKLKEILEVTGLSDKRKSLPAQLSGGQQQRVSIARAVIGKPQIILADEPTGNLDSHATTEVMNLFKRLNENDGLTILQVTHSPECASFGNKIFKIEDGHIS